MKLNGEDNIFHTKKINKFTIAHSHAIHPYKGQVIQKLSFRGGIIGEIKWNKK